jgi:Mg-chelatase subunit ChlD
MLNILNKLKDSPELSLSDAKEYDYILLMDQSGSMSEPSTKMAGKSRWNEAEEFTLGFARFADQVDADGITIINFNSSHTVYDGVNAEKVKELFSKNRPGGSTNLAGALEAAFQKHFSNSKPSIIVCMTDGVPDSEPAVVKSIIAAANKLDKDAQLAIQFVQVGDNKEAAAFLTRLDDNLQKEGAKFDIVNALTREEAESITIEQLLYQAIND